MPGTLSSGSSAAIAATSVPVVVSVVLAEEHAGMRRTLRRLIDGQPDLRVVAEADTRDAAVQAARRHRATVLVLDLSLADNASLDVIPRLAAAMRATSIVVISMHDDAPVAQLLQRGAVGFVLKDHADSELAPVIRAASQAARLRGTPFASVGELDGARTRFPRTSSGT
ncbi:MAG TPA: response regulator transcription factor [Solirubrobacteraceae bacterium]|nr:response regulator transcription factor [Solirubrobacteraceae bacterium]